MPGCKTCSNYEIIDKKAICKVKALITNGEMSLVQIRLLVEHCKQHNNPLVEVKIINYSR